MPRRKKNDVQAQITVTTPDGKVITLDQDTYAAFMAYVSQVKKSPVEKARDNIATIAKAVPFLQDIKVLNAVEAGTWTYVLLTGKNDSNKEQFAIVKWNAAYARLIKGVIDGAAKALFNIA